MNRVYEIDTLKIFAVLLVVLGHMNSPFTKLIFSFHMPLFLFISGFLFSPTYNLKSQAVKDSKRLLIPFFIFTALGLIVEVLKRSVLKRSFDGFDDVVFSSFISINSHVPSYGFVLWFLPALFICKQFLNAYLLNGGNNSVSFVLFISLFYFVFFPKPSIFIFGIGQSLLGINFFILGYVVSNRTDLNKYAKSILMTAISVLVLLLANTVPLPMLDIGSATLVFKTVSIIYPYVYIAILYSLSVILFKGINKDIISILSSLSMLVFVFHPYSNNIAYLFVNKIVPNLSWNYIFIFLSSLILLFPLIVFKLKFNNKWMFKYV